jgi:hypothetical protein
MANILDILLGGQASLAGAPGLFKDQPLPGTAGIGDDIVSEGRRPSVVDMTQTRSLPPPAARILDETAPEDRPPQRKGLFGVKGTLREILGVLGDSLTTKMDYTNRRHQEKLSDAGVGFTQDPLSAIERVGYEDYGAGQDMQKQYQTNELGKATIDNRLQVAQERAAAQAQIATERAAMQQQLQQERLAQQMEIARMNEAGRNKRDNPPAAPRSKSAIELFEQIDAIPPEKRSKGQQLWWEKQTSRGTKSSRTAPSEAKKPSGGRIDTSKWKRVNGTPLAQ